MLAAGETVVLAGRQRAHDGDLIVSPSEIADVLQPGHAVLIDDGLIRLVVERVELGRVSCRVLVGGEVRSRKEIVSLPAGVAIPVPCTSPTRISSTSTSRWASASTSWPCPSCAPPPTCGS